MVNNKGGDRRFNLLSIRINVCDRVTGSTIKNCLLLAYIEILQSPIVIIPVLSRQDGISCNSLQAKRFHIEEKYNILPIILLSGNFF